MSLTAIICAIYALTPFINFTFLLMVSRIITIVLFLITLFANIRLIYRGQKYAIFSLIGLVSAYTSYSIYVITETWIVPGKYANNPIYFGSLVELIMLILAILSRINFIKNLQYRESSTGVVNDKPSSRIRSFDIRELVFQLDLIMKEEKLFCDEDISLERLAGHISITRHQLSELLKEVYHTNFYGFINKLRINEAKKLLSEDRNRSILSIAMAVGYNSKSTFNHAFKKNTGVTPSQFRDMSSHSQE